MAKKFNGVASSASKDPAPEGITLDFVNEQLDTLSGFEQITQETMAIPFVRLLQKLSPQLDKQKPEFIEGSEEGQFFNTITRDVYGSEFTCIVLKFDHIYLQWRPNRGGFAGYHSVENAERLAIDKTFGDWKMANGDSLSETYVYMVLVEGHEREGIMVLSLASSMIKEARMWNKLMLTHVMSNGKAARPYYLVWTIKAEYRSNEKGSWYSPSVRFDHYIGKEQYELTQGERKMLPTRQVDYAQIEDKAQTVAASEY